MPTEPRRPSYELKLLLFPLQFESNRERAPLDAGLPLRRLFWVPLCLAGNPGRAERQTLGTTGVPACGGFGDHAAIFRSGVGRVG